MPLSIAIYTLMRLPLPPSQLDICRISKPPGGYPSVVSCLTGRGGIFATRGKRGSGGGGQREREREREIVGLWGTRGHLSVNGFCNWESVKLPNRPVHLLALLDELNQSPHVATPRHPFTSIHTDCPRASYLAFRSRLRLEVIYSQPKFF